MIFVDREEELGLLEEAYSSGKPELVVIYGRRRLGKSFLVKKFLERVSNSVYLVADYSDRGLALRSFSRQISEYFGVSVFFEWFRDLFEFAMRMLGDRPVLVIDEVQRLAGVGALSELQVFWDKYGSKYTPLLVLVGSGVGAVERLVLSYDSPIYGRATRVLRLGEFGYREARVFMEKWSPEDRVRGYAVLGGTPYYLSLVDDSETLRENVEKLVLAPGSPLSEEPLSILYAETREPDRYVAILEAIASGARRPGEIASRLGVQRDTITKYLRVLEEGLGLIGKEYPLGMEGKPRYARYRLRDGFFKFWFSEIYPRRSLIQVGRREAISKVIDRIDAHASEAWEEVALEHLELMRKQGELGFTRAGRWWWRGVEIDIIAVDEEANTVVFAECKWGRAGKKDARRLIAKAQEFPWRRGDRQEKYIIYSRDRPVEEVVEAEVYTLEDVESLMEEEKPRIEPIEL